MIIQNFLLQSDLAISLFEKTGRLPLVDYHSHLPVRAIAENKRFKNITDLWIKGDHYKWRAMRINGIAEEFCSGNASDKDKFLAWSQTVPITLRNPLYHWTQMELSRTFGIFEELRPDTAEQIWEKTNSLLSNDEFLPRQMLINAGVEILCTTDDPADSLEHHIQLAAESFEVRVIPSFRPDKAMRIDDGKGFGEWIDKLSTESRQKIKDVDTFLTALEIRHEAFHKAGCRSSDHGLEVCYSEPCDELQASKIFREWQAGHTIEGAELLQWRSFILRRIAKWNHHRGWTMMLHLGALRNNNTSIAEHLGHDAGCDSIGDFFQAVSLNRFLNSLEKDAALPKTVIFNSNPADNHLFATVTGNFFDGKTAGKIQFGPAWWFLDSMRGMIEQINSLSEVGLLYHFIGMTTDSRSFLSFSRHEYFRRILCNLIANDVKQGLIPEDEDRIHRMLEGIFCKNAKNYFLFAT
jgi:glucuronate isomerase